MIRPLAALALLLTLALAACGGDDDGDTPSSTSSAAPTATPAAPPTPSPAPGEIVEQLSYIGPGGDIRLVNVDGTGDRTFAAAPCDAGERAQGFSMAWSLDGAWLGFICAPPDSSSQMLIVMNSDAREIARVQDVSRFRWSPDSTRLAYQRSAETGVGLLDPGTGAERTLHHDAVLMEWVGPGSLLLGLEPVFGDFGTAFKAHLINVASGESTALPKFDSVGALWVSADGATAVVLSDQRDPSGSGPGMAVYDFASTLTTAIEGGYIGYPSEFIPHEQLAFSLGGATIFWANAADPPSSIWQARVDAPEARKLGEVGSLFVAVSPLGRVAGVGPPQELERGTVVIHDLATGMRVEVGRGSLPFAWRTVVH